MTINIVLKIVSATSLGERVSHPAKTVFPGRPEGGRMTAGIWLACASQGPRGRAVQRPPSDLAALSKHVWKVLPYVDPETLLLHLNLISYRLVGNRFSC